MYWTVYWYNHYHDHCLWPEIPTVSISRLIFSSTLLCGRSFCRPTSFLCRHAILWKVHPFLFLPSVFTISHCCFSNVGHSVGPILSQEDLVPVYWSFAAGFPLWSTPSSSELDVEPQRLLCNNSWDDCSVSYLDFPIWKPGILEKIHPAVCSNSFSKEILIWIETEKLQSTLLIKLRTLNTHVEQFASPRSLVPPRIE